MLIMKPIVFIDRRLSAEIMDYLEQHCTVKTYKPEESRSREKLLEYIVDCEGLFTSGGYRIDEELLQVAPKLRVVSTMSVGYNHFDVAAMQKRKVIGTHTPYVLDDTVADLAVGLMLSVGRRIAELDRLIRDGKWNGNEGRALFGFDVHHKTIGIVGAGRIGEAILQRTVLGFNMKALYYSRTEKTHLHEKFGARYCSLEHLLAQSDYVVLMVPLTPDTKGLIGKEQLAMMKRDAILINASRGAIVNEQDLVEALEQGIIRGAGLDVFEQEPIPKNHALLQLPQVVMTPHIGSATKETREKMAMLAAQNLVNALLGNGPYYKIQT